MMKRMRNIIITGLLSMAMLLGTVAFSPDSHATTWESSNFTKTASSAAIQPSGYPGLQGLAFDTFTGQDGYNFSTTLNEKKCAITHFKMDQNGRCLKEKTVIYKKALVGHANDGTIGVDAQGNKHLFVALHGSVSEAENYKDSSGKKMRLAVINLTEFNKGTKKVRKCDVDLESRYIITGVTYTGLRLVDNTLRPTYVIMSGTKLFTMYLTGSGNNLSLETYGGRLIYNKAKLPDGNSGSSQGVCYHNGYLYICYEGKSKYPNLMVIQRLPMTMFDGSGTERQCNKTIKKEGSTTLKKNAPEAVFFTSLNGKSNLYVSVNRKTSKGDADSILRTAKRF